jgi:hypothetical protein
MLAFKWICLLEVWWYPVFSFDKYLQDDSKKYTIWKKIAIDLPKEKNLRKKVIKRNFLSTLHVFLSKIFSNKTSTISINLIFEKTHDQIQSTEQ